MKIPDLTNADIEMLEKQMDAMEKELPVLGVDIDVSSLGRFQDKIAYVVGARYPDESGS